MSLKNCIIQYNRKWVGGYSFKLKTVWFVPQKEQATRMSAIRANLFITNHTESGLLDMRKIKLVTLTPEELWRIKNQPKVDKK